MPFSDIADFVFKEIPTFTKLNQWLTNLREHNHKGANQGYRIGQIAGAIPPAFSGAIGLTTSPTVVATITINPSAREVTLMAEYFLTGTAAVNFTFDTLSGNIRRPGAAVASTSDFWVKPIGPVVSTTVVQISAALASGTGSITPKVWATN